MANIFTIQTLNDGPRNVVVRLVGVLDTSDMTATDVLDPATLSSIIPAWPSGIKATALSIERVDWAIEDGLEVRLLWDATADVIAEVLMGRGKIDYRDVGGLTNNAGAGITGKIQISTQGWASGNTLSFTIKLHCKKQGSFG